jgi:tripartite-type tricarboxylate transporter receptor subunit TctC
MLGRRLLLAASGASLLQGHFARAEPPPPQTAAAPRSRRLTLLTGGQPGGRADISARTFAPFLERYLPDTDVSVVNVAGRGGDAAAERAATADAATLVWIATPNLTANIGDRRNAGLLDRINWLGAVQLEPIVIVTAPSEQTPDLAGLIARIAADSSPFGTPPPGSPPYLAMLRLQMLAGHPLNLVPFAAASAARQAVLEGTAAAAALPLGEALADLTQQRLTGLAIASQQRLPLIPDIPTMAEAGYSVTCVIRRGLAASASLSAGTVARFAAALQTIAADPDFAEEGNGAGFAAEWLNGAAWKAEAEAGRKQIAQLWEKQPWRMDEGG